MSITATYISASSFSVAGDQTTDFHTGRRVKLVGDSTWYGTILTAAYSSLTTITLTAASDNMDNTLTGVLYGVISGKEDDCSMPIHTHDGDEGSGGIVTAVSASIAASEDPAAGDLVNVYDDSGAKCRKADATAKGKEASGFVLAAVTSGNNATIYFQGFDTEVTGLTPGVQFLSTTAGACTATAPSSSGNIVQKLGVATAATSMNFEAGNPIELV